MTHFSTGQLRELLQIDAAGNGIHDELQALIRRLTSGGVSGKFTDIRKVQAKRFWDLGVGSALNLPSFDAYLATIPEIPAELLADDGAYPLIVLVESRIGLKRLCDLGNVEFDGDDDTFVACSDKYVEFANPTWIRIQDGRKNRNRSALECRRSFAKHECGLTALQGVCAYLQHPSVLSDFNCDGGHGLDLSGSVVRRNRGWIADFRLTSGGARIARNPEGAMHPKFGTATRRMV
jgi:hypothetical protein